MKRHERRRVTVPEAPPRPADVPVRQVVDERLERLDQVRRPRALVRVRHLGDELIAARLEPAVERPELACLARLGDVRVVDEELDRVPERQQPALHLVRRPVAELDVLARVGLAELPAHDVRAHLIERLVGGDRVPPGAVHLAPVLVEQLLVGEHGPVGRLPDERHRHERDRVEPEPDLLAHLRDPVRGEPLLPVRVVGQVRAGQTLGRARRVAVLDPLGVVPAEGRERDDARVEPGVADLRDPAHVLAAGGARDRDVVDPRPVQLLQPVDARGRALLELCPRPDHVQRRRSRTDRRAAATRSSASGKCSSRPCCEASRPSASSRSRASTGRSRSRRASAGGSRRRR